MVDASGNPARLRVQTGAATGFVAIDVKCGAIIWEVGVLSIWRRTLKETQIVEEAGIRNGSSSRMTRYLQAGKLCSQVVAELLEHGDVGVAIFD